MNRERARQLLAGPVYVARSPIPAVLEINAENDGAEDGRAERGHYHRLQRRFPVEGGFDIHVARVAGVSHLHRFGSRQCQSRSNLAPASTVVKGMVCIQILVNDNPGRGPGLCRL
jgi:hypothetical protein